VKDRKAHPSCKDNSSSYDWMRTDFTFTHVVFFNFRYLRACVRCIEKMMNHMLQLLYQPTRNAECSLCIPNQSVAGQESSPGARHSQVAQDPLPEQMIFYGFRDPVEQTGRYPGRHSVQPPARSDFSPERLKASFG
jgi:hypothetical protein